MNAFLKRMVRRAISVQLSASSQKGIHKRESGHKEVN